MAQHVDNIGERGARRRMLGGWVWAGVAVVVAIVLMMTHAPRPSRLVLAVPVGLAALGFLQAREKT